MISACPDFKMSNAVRNAVRSAVCRTTGNAWYCLKIHATNPPLSKYSDFAMFQVSERVTNAGTNGGSRVAEWFGQMTKGPERGTFSRPETLNKPTKNVRVIARMSQRMNA